MKRMQLTIKAILVVVLSVTAQIIYALPSDFFSETSKLSEGEWVKISVKENGIYEISYDQLREMGFKNPERVGVYGRGGEEQPIQFMDKTSTILYADDLQPVVVMHKDEKIYFYGQGPVRIRYKYELSNPTTQRFIRHNINTYSEYGYYFLSEGRDDVLNISDAVGELNETNPAMTECWDYFYYEKEIVNIGKSGQVFFGDSFVDATTRELAIPYTIPGAIVGSSGSLECRFAASNGSGSKLEYGFTDAMTTANIKSCIDLINFEYADPSKVEITIPASSGNIYLRYLPSGQVKTANLDYVLLGAKKLIGFNGDESQFRAFIPNYQTSSYGYISIQNALETSMAWDVTNSNKVVNLPISYVDGVANVKYFESSKKDGMMMVFDTSRPQFNIVGYEKVENQNLHGCETPDMLIITNSYLYEKAEALAELHRLYDGIDVLVVDTKDVINEFSAGTPDAMAYRAICKMFYDRNPEKFKNLLLFGEYHYNNRMINLDRDYDMLISYQTPESRIYDQSFNVGDYYGMMSDFYEAYASGTNMYNRSIQIGVGHLPCRSLSEADIVINKIAQYILDDSYAYWLGNIQFLADGPDKNEHQNHCEDLSVRFNNISEGDFCISKVYLNSYDKGFDKMKMLQNFDNGVLLSTYFGHANVYGLSSSETFWYSKDARLLKNKRLSFMNYAACSVTGSDYAIRGSSEVMLFTPDYGIIGGIMSNRSSYSNQNNYFMAAFNEACLLENPSNSKTELLSTPKTIGEIYAETKTNLATSLNEYAYQLICDPAIVLPLPTAEVCVDKVVVGESEYSEDIVVSPSSLITINGSIKNRDGEVLSDFNGVVVARVFNAPVVQKTMGLYSDAVDVEYDENVLATYEFDIADGKFSGAIVVPQILRATSEGEYASIRLSAYDTEQRKAAIGKQPISVSEYDSNQAINDFTSPIIDAFYINSENFSEGSVIGSDFMVYATISDDLAMKLDINEVQSNLLLTLDDETVFPQIANYTTISDANKKINIAFPLENVSCGYHTLTIYASDMMGNKVNGSISFQVYEGEIGGELEIDSTPVRETAMLKLKLNNTEINQTATLYIVDSLGKTILSEDISSEYEWNLSDSSGNRVPQGLYYAHVKLSAGDVLKGVVSPVEIVVLKEK